ncbi:MAG: hypothetical protein RIC84_07870 [Aggregatilineales bacterium]
MNLYLEPEGFLGTGASLLADLTLIGYIFILAPAMIGGSYLAWRGLHRPHHKYLMIGVTVANWILIGLLMFAAIRFDVADNIGEQPGNSRYFLPVIHGLLGFSAQFLATYIVYRMIKEDVQVARAKKRKEADLTEYWFLSAKWTMRLTLALWLAVTTLGIITYLHRYDVLENVNLGSSSSETSGASPVATEEALSPEATEDALSPAMTEEPVITEEPVMTEEAEIPVETEEADDDDDDDALEPAATEESN